MKITIVQGLLLEMLLILSLIAIATGCGNPEPEPAPAPDIHQQYKALRDEHIALQYAHNILLVNYEQLAEAKKEFDASLVKYNELDYQHRVLQANYDLVVAQYNSMNTYYEELFNTIAPDEDALKVMNDQYQAMVERHKVIDERLAALRAGKCKEISDNLTASELKVFNRGVKIWWETFNE